MGFLIESEDDSVDVTKIVSLHNFHEFQWIFLSGPMCTGHGTTPFSKVGLEEGTAEGRGVILLRQGQKRESWVPY